MFVNDRAAIHAGSEGRAVAQVDVNLCPPAPPAGPVPLPLPNLGLPADLEGGASTVSIGGNPMATRSSYFARSTGNAMARGTGGGLLTHVVEGKTYFVTHALNVMVEGEEVPRAMDLTTHNHASDPRNTVGTYVGPLYRGTPQPQAPRRVETADRDERSRVLEVAIEAPAGLRSSAVLLELVSVDARTGKKDGRCDQRLLSTQGQAKVEGLAIVSFPGLEPGRHYSLYQVVGNTRLPVFERLSFAMLRDHQATIAKLEGQAPRYHPGPWYRRTSAGWRDESDDLLKYAFPDEAGGHDPDPFEE